MSDHPLTSVIIPAFNAERYVRRAIESALAQSSTNHEVIVVDDGSVDSTPHICQEFSSRIRYFRQQNGGVSSARNCGASVAGGDVLVFLDADDVLRPHAVSLLEAPLRANERLGGCSGIVFISGRQGGDLHRPEPGRFASGEVDLYDFMVSSPIPTASGVAVKKSCFVDVGGFTEGMRFGEDLELWNRIYGRYDWFFVSETVSEYHRCIDTSVMCVTPFHETGFDYVWSTEQMRRLVRPERHKSYQMFKLNLLLAKARLAFVEDARDYGREAMRRIDCFGSRPRVLKWRLVYSSPRLMWELLRRVPLIARCVS